MKNFIKNFFTYLPKSIRRLVLSAYEYYFTLKAKKILRISGENFALQTRVPNIKPKILFYHVSGLSFGGTEKFLQILAKYINKQKYDVLFLYSPKPRRETGINNKLDGRIDYLKNENVKLISFDYVSFDEKYPYILRGAKPSIFEVINNEKIDSVVISKNDFIKTENRIYSNWEYKLRDHFFALIFILLIAICIGLYLSFYWKKIRQLKISETEGANINEKTVFTENEISLLKILLHNSLEKVETSIYDVDSVLGLQKKPINLQKKHRSDVLRSLNLKLALTLRSSKEVIIRIRNKEDKRSFNYKIDETFTTQVLDLLERNDSN